jgi:hypothetical protein
VKRIRPAATRRATGRGAWSRVAALALAIVMAASVAVGVGTGAAEPANAATNSFNPGAIISDDSFFNYQSMSATDVQTFLESLTCIPRDASPCLADYRQDTTTKAAALGHCSRLVGEKNEKASHIVWRVAQACRINPRVLLVLLQKEQSLLTSPRASGYQRATGYACPDTAACDATYFGFFNQVYSAAWQFREYTLHPSDWRYHIGRVTIQYSPNPTCGSTAVQVKNQATANLYNYTPYQPNPYTVANPRGAVQPCSTYGNLNFSRIYTAWFGSPLDVRFSDWLPACLNFVGGHDCPAPPSPLDTRP